MSQTVTLSERHKLQVEKIKEMLLDNKPYLDMSRELKISRRTLYRRIDKWVKTGDFETWLKHAWLNKYQKVSDLEAYKGLTRLLSYIIPRKIEKREEILRYSIEEKMEWGHLPEREREAIICAARIIARVRSKKQPIGIH